MGVLIDRGTMMLGQVAPAGADAGGLGGAPLVVLIPLFVLAALALVVGLPVVLGIRSEQRRREMEHAERMRAIELGRPIPGDDGWWTPARLAVGIGVFVPIIVFGIGWVAALTTEAAPFIWPSVGAVGLAAVICGTVLATRLPSPARPAAPDRPAKPYVDPDAYDAAEHQHAWDDLRGR